MAELKQFLFFNTNRVFLDRSRLQIYTDNLDYHFESMQMICVGSDSVIKVNITTNWWSPSLMLVKDERIMEMTADMALIVLVSKKMRFWAEDGLQSGLQKCSNCKRLFTI